MGLGEPRTGRATLKESSFGTWTFLFCSPRALGSSFFAMSAPPTVLPIAATSAEYRSPQTSEPQSPATGPVKATKPTLSQMLRDHTESMDRQRKVTGTLPLTLLSSNRGSSACLKLAIGRLWFWNHLLASEPTLPSCSLLTSSLTLSSSHRAKAQGRFGVSQQGDRFDGRRSKPRRSSRVCQSKED